jgi:dTDP-4-dehydrorhamnose reductase
MKAVGEALVSAICPDSAVARTASVFGQNVACPDPGPKPQGTGAAAVIDYCLHRLSRGEPPLIWAEHVNMAANPSLATDVADTILTIAHGDHRGTFHSTGQDGVDRFSVARAVAEVFGFDPELVRVATRREMASEIDIASERPSPWDTRVTVASTEARLGRSQLRFREALAEYRRQLADADVPF